jgi:trehalose 6-phosphate synthase
MQTHEGNNSRPLVVVANRLPLVFNTHSGWRPSPGGLVAVLTTALRDLDGLWIGCSGRFHEQSSDDPIAKPPQGLHGFDLEEVILTSEEYSGYYEGCSNSAMWPLYHSLIAQAVYSAEHFEAYKSVNKKFALKVAEMAPLGADVWVHDYHLQLVPATLKQLRPDIHIGFFLHIPFPPVEMFEKLPWSREILLGLLGADLIGFQTEEYERNFQEQVKNTFHIPCNRARVLVGDLCDSSMPHVGVYPVGVDAGMLADIAQQDVIIEKAEEFRRSLGDPDLIFLGVDRLDYTKGIEVRIRAIAELFRSRELNGKSAVFIQSAMPSRENLTEYQNLRNHIEAMIRDINADLQTSAANSIQCEFQPLDRDSLLAMYVAADIMLVTPLRDGMNLVCKEYVACRNNNTGALVLSEFAGAAKSMQSAWLVNPYNLDDVKSGIVSAANASSKEAQRRMLSLREDVFKYDARSWANSFIESLASLS